MKENIKVKILLWVVFALFMIYILTLMVPLYYLILNSFKTSGDFVQNRWAFPKKFTFENFVRAFEIRSGDTTLAMMFVNSVLLSVGATVVSVGVYIGKVPFFRTEFPRSGCHIRYGLSGSR